MSKQRELLAKLRKSVSHMEWEPVSPEPPAHFIPATYGFKSGPKDGCHFEAWYWVYPNPADGRRAGWTIRFVASGQGADVIRMYHSRDRWAKPITAFNKCLDSMRSAQRLLRGAIQQAGYVPI